MPRYGGRGFPGDIIPAHGEARVLAELKGGYGKKPKGANMRRSRFNAMRRGAYRNKPQTWIPLAPGPQGSTSNRPDQTAYWFQTPGSISEIAPDAGWLFAITPEASNLGTLARSIVPIGGEANANEQYRVLGLSGKLHWTAQVSLEDPDNDPTAWSGFLSTYWYKVKASLAETSPAAGEPVAYPWSGGWDDTTNTQNTHVRGFVPYTNQAYSVATGDPLRGRDPRWRRDLMFHTVQPWRLEVMPIFDTVTQSVVYQYLAQRPIRVPLPRRVVCNVGRGEALACAYHVWSQSGSQAGSSPVGIFNFQDLRIKVMELG